MVQLGVKEKDMKDAAAGENRAETEFLSAVSHEIKTPLNVIVGMCDIAVHHADDRKRVEACLHKICTAADRISEMLDTVLDMARIEQGKTAMKEKPFNIRELTCELTDMLEPLAAEKNVILSISDENVINSDIAGDRGRIIEIMLNLATNSIKYTPSGGCIDIDICERSNDAADKVTYVFRCRDNGIGIPEDFRPHIFEPFSRSSNVCLTKADGSGLGMYIVKSLVDAIGGTIKIESTEGMGTEVTVEAEFKATEHKRIW